MRKLLILILTLSVLLAGCGAAEPAAEVTRIDLSDAGVTVDGEAVTEAADRAVYTAKDIVFYLAGQDLTYGEGTEADAHSQSEADAHTVVHITQPGKYVLSGQLSLGQIAVDLGADAKTDPNAVVTLILDNVNITCTVAPAVIFYNVYECGSSDTQSASADVDTAGAGANVIIADGSENNITGSYVAKIYKSCTLNEDGTEVVDSKKLHKYDGAFYSKMSMNVDGEETGSGVLNIFAENEGMDSELHLTLNGGTVNIRSGNDGINTNEDNVSVTTVNGGTVNIRCTGETGEGDGIDSNGYLVINGGTVAAQACGLSADAGIDSDLGIYINGGSVVASGNMLDQIAGGDQTYAVFSFAQSQSGGLTYTLKNAAGETAAEYTPENAFTVLVAAGDDLAPGEYTFWQGDTQLAAVAQGMSGGMGGRPGMGGGQRPEGFGGQQRPEGEMPEGGMPGGEMPENFTPGEMPEGFDPGQMPENFAPGEMPEDFDPGRVPQGDAPAMPEGGDFTMPEGMTPPQGMGAMPEGALSVTFPIEAGGNLFSGVSPAQSGEAVAGNLRTYTQRNDGTWECDGYSYQYRLEIQGRMPNAAADSTFVYLSNLETISFEQAWKAAGLSSNLEDYFSPEEAVLVDWQTGDAS